MPLPPSTTVRHSFRHTAVASWVALWIVLCLLFAQWLGYAHAIGHAGNPNETVSSQISADNQPTPSFDHQKAGSACAALDATSLGAGLNSLPLLSLPLAPPVIKIEFLRSTLWQQIVTTFFSSRAPPFIH